MSTTTGLQRPLSPASVPAGKEAIEENIARSASQWQGTARAIAVRAGQLLVWVLVTVPIAFVLTGLCLALIGAAFALVAG